MGEKDVLWASCPQWTEHLCQKKEDMRGGPDALSVALTMKSENGSVMGLFSNLL